MAMTTTTRTSPAQDPGTTKSKTKTSPGQAQPKAQTQPRARPKQAQSQAQPRGRRGSTSHPLDHLDPFPFLEKDRVCRDMITTTPSLPKTGRCNMWPWLPPPRQVQPKAQAQQGARPRQAQDKHNPRPKHNQGQDQDKPSPKPNPRVEEVPPVILLVILTPSLS